MPDMALGIGGYPKGRVVEIYGPESSGKTTLAKRITNFLASTFGFRERFSKMASLSSYTMLRVTNRSRNLRAA